MCIICSTLLQHTSLEHLVFRGLAESICNGYADWDADSLMVLVQAQRDFFGSHTYERIDKPGWFHTVWDPRNSADSITTSSYNN